jgi:hypothetical protein
MRGLACQAPDQRMAAMIVIETSVRTCCHRPRVDVHNAFSDPPEYRQLLEVGTDIAYLTP